MATFLFVKVVWSWRLLLEKCGVEVDVCNWVAWRVAYFCGVKCNWYEM